MKQIKKATMINTTESKAARKINQLECHEISTRDGLVVFKKHELTDNDGKFLKYEFSKNDCRTYTSIGNSYFAYSNEKSFLAALKRYQKQQ
jgi:hypothetical protein